MKILGVHGREMHGGWSVGRRERGSTRPTQNGDHRLLLWSWRHTAVGRALGSCDGGGLGNCPVDRRDRNWPPMNTFLFNHISAVGGFSRSDGILPPARAAFPTYLLSVRAAYMYGRYSVLRSILTLARGPAGVASAPPGDR